RFGVPVRKRAASEDRAPVGDVPIAHRAAGGKAVGRGGLRILRRRQRREPAAIFRRQRAELRAALDGIGRRRTGRAGRGCARRGSRRRRRALREIERLRDLRLRRGDALLERVEVVAQARTGGEVLLGRGEALVERVETALHGVELGVLLSLRRIVVAAAGR